MLKLRQKNHEEIARHNIDSLSIDLVNDVLVGKKNLLRKLKDYERKKEMKELGEKNKNSVKKVKKTKSRKETLKRL